MGVKDLNKIAEAKDEDNENAGFPFVEEGLYDHIIIDCSNLEFLAQIGFQRRSTM